MPARKKKSNRKNESPIIGIIAAIVAVIVIAFNYFETIEMDSNESNYLFDEVVEHKEGFLKVHIIDVGQGDSILIETENSNMLIDAGENNKESIVVDYIKRMGIESLDYVIGTHPHSDHIGGLDGVIREFNIENILLPKVEHTTVTYENMIDAIISKNLSVTIPVVGESFHLGEAVFTIISPNSDSYDNLNNYSVGIKLEYAGKSFVLTGDAEELSEKEMLRSGIDLKANVLKLGHHGSSTSTSESFLDEVNPDFVVVSVGADNSYGHPHKEILALLEQKQIPVYRTDEEGNIVIEVTANGELHKLPNQIK